MTPKPQHASQWRTIAALPEFRALIQAKARFLIPATVFFVCYYFALPVLVGYAPELMARRVIGPVNLAYLFALSQFFMAWILAWIYLRVAARWDRRGREILSKTHESEQV